jgi:hypothetical protein
MNDLRVMRLLMNFAPRNLICQVVENLMNPIEGTGFGRFYSIFTY